MTVLVYKRSAIAAYCSICLLGLLTSCANSPTSASLEQSLAADPKLQNHSQKDHLVQLPSGFPPEIPIYPEAKLKEVTPISSQPSHPQSTGSGQGQLTHWTTSDPSNLVQSFYQRQLQSNGWQLSSQPNQDNTATNTIEARRYNLKVTVSFPTATSIQPATVPSPTASQSPGGATPSASPSQSPVSATEFTLQYIRDLGSAAVPQPSPANNTTDSPQPASSSGSPQAADSSNFTDLNKAPAELRQYIEDLAVLGVLIPSSSGSKSNSSAIGSQFEPNKAISRREFARWLVAANNQFYSNRPDRQIRLASDASQPAFQDVPRTDPEFPAIQGLAEAGLISSPLSGDTTTVLFRPDAPLTRENLILWKEPLDIRRALPPASIDAVKQTWGFQDAARIDPKALQAVLADFQNGETSNIRRVFGYTTLFQPQKPVTRSEAAAALWYFGSQGEGLSAKDALKLKNQPPTPTPSSSPSPQPTSTP